MKHTPTKYKTPITPAQLRAYRGLEERYGAKLSPLPPYRIVAPGRYRKGDYIGVTVPNLFIGIEADGYTHT